MSQTQSQALSKLIKEVSDEVDGDSETAGYYSYFNPKKFWSVRTSDMDKFWTGYCNLVDADYRGESIGVMAIGENPSKFVPILVDCTLKFQTGHKRLTKSKENSGESDNVDLNVDEWLDKFILSLTYCYQRAIMDNLIISDTRAELISCVFTQDRELYEDNFRVIQVKLQFPYCKTESHIQSRLIIPSAISYLRQLNVIGIFPQQPIGDWDSQQVISKISANNPWPLYGSITKPNESKMSLSMIIAEITEEDFESNTIREIEFDQAFDPKAHKYILEGLVSRDFVTQHEDDPNFYIPFVLSLNYCNSITKPKPEMNSKDLKMPIKKKSLETPTGFTKDNPSEDDPLSMCEQLLPLISDKRLEENTNAWLEIGKALWNADRGSRKALEIWGNYSEQHELYDSELCEEKWDEFSYNNPITVKTIAWYARIDSPNEYKKWIRQRLRKYLESAASCTHTDVAMALYWVYWLDFTCASAKNKSWYVFKDHIFVPCDNGSELKQKISKDFLNYFENLRTEVSMEISQMAPREEGLKPIKEALIKKINNLISKLKTVAYKNNIMTEAMELFKDDNFEKYANLNENLTAFDDGIVEVTHDDAIIRDGKPEDYITIKSATKIRRPLSWDNPNVKRFMHWMKQVFPDEGLKEYALKLIASCLKSKNKEKILPVFTGSNGNNSKSMFKKMIELVFGPYCMTFPLSVLTNGKKSGPTPELALAKYCKITFGQEPDENSLLSAAFFKEISGLDKISVRLLFENGGNIEVLFTMFLICNKMPLIPGADKAIMNRLRAIPFLSTWVTNPPESIEEQFKQRLFKLDKNFESTLNSMSHAAAWVFVQYYIKYVTEGLQEPELVKKTTEEYWKDNDMYRLFLKECTDPAILPGSKTEANPKGIVDGSKKVKITELYQAFKFFIKDSYPNIKVPSAPDFKFQLIQRMGCKPIKNEYSGMILKDAIASI